MLWTLRDCHVTAPLSVARPTVPRLVSRQRSLASMFPTSSQAKSTIFALVAVSAHEASNDSVVTLSTPSSATYRSHFAPRPLDAAARTSRAAPAAPMTEGMRRTAVLMATAAIVAYAGSCTRSERTAQPSVGPEGSSTPDRRAADLPSSDQLPGSSPSSLPAALPSDPAEAYLEMVRPSNCALYRYQAAHASLIRDGRIWREDWERIESEVLPFSVDFAAEQWRLLESFQAFDWPDAVLEFKDAFENEIRQEAEWRDELNAVTTWARFEIVYNRQPPDERVGVDIREALALPPSREDTDPCVSTDDGTVRRTM